jgi:hypothetical protein
MKSSHSLAVFQSRKTPISEVSRVSPPSLLRRYFEYDRTQAADRLKAMTAAARDNAFELEMTAAEKIFEEAICGEFLRVANEFTSLEQKLTLLNGLVVKAKGYPAENVATQRQIN